MCEIIGLPIHNLILNGDDAPQIFVDKYVLLENKDKNKGNIESYANDPIPVTQYIPQYVKKLWELHNAVMNLLESALKLSFKQIVILPRKTGHPLYATMPNLLGV
ncbi:hypothetical protein [Legionella septentrionalis]|uniref:hypothetical protein n=1 Tax=Legionella septentrionalis TaxID=2498109 RepID=UPI000F8D49B3|nr:hypothetical protein [Legionella septentrionalis]RUR08904.1 hypothetical protein ELY14_10435 [Legionella septentrionalis]